MSNIQINPTTKWAIGYSNSPIKFKGQTNLYVECNNIKVSHTFLIVDSNSVSLLARDLCSKLNIEITRKKKLGRFDSMIEFCRCLQNVSFAFVT